MGARAKPFGELLRSFRARRHASQLALACDAEISTKHLSFLETGRSTPSREMVLKLSRVLDVPLRERNELLFAAGFAPAFPERPLDHPALAAARQAVELVLAAHEPNPALAIDRYWNLVAANASLASIVAGAAPKLLEPPVNVLRLSLHPDGLAPRIRNWGAWRAHLLDRLHAQVQATGDPRLRDLEEELRGYPGPDGARADAHVNPAHAGIAVVLELATDAGVMSFLSTTTVFGTPVDVTVSELAIESFFPADQATAELVRDLAGRR